MAITDAQTPILSSTKSRNHFSTSQNSWKTVSIWLHNDNRSWRIDDSVLFSEGLAVELLNEFVLVDDDHKDQDQQDVHSHSDPEQSDQYADGDVDNNAQHGKVN